MLFPSFFVNQNGVPCIESTAVSVNGTTDVRYTFKNRPFLLRFVGFAGIKLNATPTGATTTLPLVAIINSNVVPITNNMGELLTVGDFPGEGVYWAYLNAFTGEFKLLNIV